MKIVDASLPFINTKPLTVVAATRLNLYIRLAGERENNFPILGGCI